MGGRTAGSIAWPLQPIGGSTLAPMHLVRFAQLPTHLGPMLAAWSDAGVAALSRRTDLDAFLSGVLRRIPAGRAAPADGQEADRLAASINAYLEGGARRIAATADLTGLPGFDAEVYRAVMAIPYGATATYGEIAARVGSPRAARAVGNAMARCPLFPLVPCHRVVSATGLGGWGADPSMKRRLLDMERRAVATCGPSRAPTAGRGRHRPRPPHPRSGRSRRRPGPG